MADGTKIGSAMLVSKRWPWNAPRQRAPFVVALLIRGGCAAALAAVVAAQAIDGWSDKPLALFLIGLAAPTVVQHGARIARVIIRAILSEYLPGAEGGRDA